MPFIALNGLTEAGTGKTIQAGGMPVHYHDVGRGDTRLVPPPSGPGPPVALPNFSTTGPVVYHEGVHALQARTAVGLLDALGIERAHWVGNSQGGQSAMGAATAAPARGRGVG